MQEHYVTARELADLNRFVGTAWGNPQALTARLHPHDVEYIDLGDHLSILQIMIFGGILRHDDMILVRNEYHVALQELQASKPYEQGAYVIGQPGIGKTYFLVYALVHLLRQKQPVAFKLFCGGEFYALLNDTVAIYPLSNTTPLEQFPIVWALCDSNSVHHSPATTFQNLRNVRIIQATSPQASRWRAWSRQTGARPYIMNIWSEEEVVQLAILMGLDDKRMTALARKWGNIPRTLLLCMRHEKFGRDGNTEYEYTKLAGAAVWRCATAITQAEKLDIPYEDLLSFYFLRPHKTEEGVIQRTRACVYIPTPKLRCMLAEALQWQMKDTKLEFYEALNQRMETRQTAGFIFQSWFHTYMSTGGHMRCKWIGADSDDEGVELGRSENLQVYTSPDPPRSRTTPYYWIPPNGCFPGIDSILVHEKEIFAFQITIGSEYESPIEGMEQLRAHLSRRLKNPAWRVVCVGPEEDSIVEATKALWFSMKKTHVPVGWSAVDPAWNWEGVRYTEFHEGPDPMA